MKLENVSSRYGAPMGRRECRDIKPVFKSVSCVRINHGGYDSGGAYWGIGKPLYMLTQDDSEFRVFLRADSRADAMKKSGLAGYMFKRGER